MSTRAFLTVIDDKKQILDAAFIPSDAYPSNTGLEVLDFFEKGEFRNYIARTREEYPHELDMVEGIQRSWYVKDKNNKDSYFHDYAYEYDISKQKLNLFHFGDKAFTISQKDVPLYRYLFEQEDNLYIPLCLDSKTMTLKKDFYKELRSMIKNGMRTEDFQAIINENTSVLYMNSGRILDRKNYFETIYGKHVYNSENPGEKLSFYIYEHNSSNKANLYIQTPFVRWPIHPSSFRSYHQAEKALADMIRTNPDALRHTMDVFKDCKSFNQTIHQIFEDPSMDFEEQSRKAQELKEQFLEKLSPEKQSAPVIGIGIKQLMHEVKQSYHNTFAKYYRIHQECLKDAEKNETKNHQSVDTLISSAQSKNIQKHENQEFIKINSLER